MTLRVVIVIKKVGDLVFAVGIGGSGWVAGEVGGVTIYIKPYPCLLL